MRITSQLICQAADQLKGFVGFNRKTQQYIVRFIDDRLNITEPLRVYMRRDDVPEITAVRRCLS